MSASSAYSLDAKWAVRNSEAASRFFLSHLNIMVVDDQAAIRKIVGRMLGDLGVNQILEAANGKEALALLGAPGAPAVDLVICDMCMEVMDRTAFCNVLRTSDLPELQNLPVLLLTAVRDKPATDVAIRACGVEVAHKPISIPDLRSRIESIVGLTWR